MQFIATLLKVSALVSVVVAQSSFCQVNRNGPKQHCTVQFKTDPRSLRKLNELNNSMRLFRCPWMGPNDIVVNQSTGQITSDLPVGFVDMAFSKAPQFRQYIASKNCN